MRIKFEKYPRIMAGLSERSDGSMVWWNRLPVDKTIVKNRDAYFKKLKIDPGRVIAGGIAHGANVAVVGEKQAGRYLLNTDALITNIPNLFLTITAADCLPIYCFDPMSQTAGIIHAGWKGLVNGILENTINKFREIYNARAEDLKIIIGPHIKSCHYKVKEEVANQFTSQSIEERNGDLFVNLNNEAKKRLMALGVRNIVIDTACTYEEEKFYSARRDKAKPLEGMVAYIGMKK